eukprot:14318720-Ditylum_brightwellii.AAC.1
MAKLSALGPFINSSLLTILRKSSFKSKDIVTASTQWTAMKQIRSNRTNPTMIQVMNLTGTVIHPFIWVSAKFTRIPRLI